MIPPVAHSLALLVGLSASAHAQEPAPDAPPTLPFVESLPHDLAGVPGTWDLSRDGTNRRCMMTLSGESGEAGRRLTFPAGCRRALPVLNGVAGWLFTDGTVRLVDKNVRPVLPFTRRADARSLVAQSEAGESYSLVPLQIVAMVPPVGADAATPATVALPGAPQADAPEASLPGGPPQAGTYALDRYREQDVCRIELTAGGAVPAPVRILDGCRDSGLSVFDPVSWRFANGRLTLNARRGHVVTLVPAGDGRWRRDPEVGTTFLLHRVEPGAP
ncbi:AprI/Inh family metalloprotease inhibitor [Methylobacterium sp. BTF04]|uniref:AprI/Inh family metalloprotease inhibitor n=1 Tax=Methylobacterium sp. BTF04 TaxID=2708300 RepID=UPI0013CFF7FE|nr:AprI/Inh family metalloprotease inhibitor [Methylobacterium sp. BTF04]NEU13515.1 AprI/Inh family metalloprotease inhibitor [Methylobacterium sp. BTF04]